MLNRKKLGNKRPMEKLNHKMFGQFVVTPKAGSRTNEIELRVRWNIHPVFHINLLPRYHEDRVSKPPKLILRLEIVDNEPSYVVAEVVDR